MSTRAQDWENLLIMGQPLPASTATEELPLPDGIYICTDCKAVNRDFKWVCDSCADPNGGDQDDD